jgi:DNA-binding transcriptional MerR regulator
MATSAARTGGSSTGRGRMSIGEVLNTLKPDFPDVSISKIRFLEAEGLVEPERTAAGYRKFSHQDLERLRYILTAQRDRYYPLKVIKQHLEAMERGLEPPDARSDEPRVPRAIHAVKDLPPASDFGPTPSQDIRLTRSELLANSGLEATHLDQLVDFGMIRFRPGTKYFDADALAVATAVAEMTEYGLEPRHIRAFKTAADREVGLIEQIVSPMAKQRGEGAQARADEVVRELGALSVRLHATLVKIGLRAQR